VLGLITQRLLEAFESTYERLSEQYLGCEIALDHVAGITTLSQKHYTQFGDHMDFGIFDRATHPCALEYFQKTLSESVYDWLSGTSDDKIIDVRTD